MTHSEKEAKLKEMADQINNLTMRIPSKMVTNKASDITTIHPYDYIVSAFPTYESFQDYFSELALEYRTMGSYEDFLRSLYNNILGLKQVINSLEDGIEPVRLNLMFRSFQMFMKMSQRKYQLSNTRMTRVHNTH